MRTVDAAGLTIGETAPTRIMGVLNVSPESPYDPSVYTDPGAAARFADQLIEHGADIVDIGLATANKRFEPLSAHEELDRLDLAVDTMQSATNDAIFSIETRYHEVANAAIDQGFELVNDVCGFADPELPVVCADHGIAVVKMASPPDLSRPGALDSVDEIHEAIKRGGFTNRTIIDPAFGGWSESKTLEDDRDLFRRLEEFRAYGRPMLVSINRKNFLRELAGRSTDDALAVSVAATTLVVERGASVIRTHDVAATKDAAIIADTLGQTRYIKQDEDTVTVTQLDTYEHGALYHQLSELGVDPTRAADWTWRAFAIDGLEEERWLHERLEEIGLSTYGTSPMIVAGSLRAFRRLHGLVHELPPPADSVLKELVESMS